MLNGPLTLEAVESFFPDRSVTVEEQCDTLGLNPAQRHLFRKIHGLDVMRCDPGLDLYDLVLPAARGLLARTDPATIRYVVHARASQEVAPSTVDVAREFADRLGLSHATAFSLTDQNCASPLAAIDVVGELLRSEADPQARALVITGEKAFTRELKVFHNTFLAGDGAASCLVSRTGRGARIQSYVSETFGEFSDGMRMGSILNQRFADERPRIVREVLHKAVAQAGCSLDDIHLVLPTNPNVVLWDETARELGLPPGRIFTANVPRYSHCLSADLLINYVTLREEGRLEPGRKYLFFALGLGFTFAAMVFTEGEHQS
ncbi:ketoacyl-ACP synthase III family protein [Dactylosporangium roseum]|uniref:Ketoacyl-ACP synthase III family protein n=1 Tax=Dactylosporangium roseum TaxID=47989 RepID=A0ABY5YYG2_9ACTN|nr:ketoacyl-ACP synthase III family protein [Dactylosporangium roseum]UWZ34791.1 ketoacyl-ACP synthase III family protein [Dactylosporangium roseum]